MTAGTWKALPRVRVHAHFPNNARPPLVALTCEAGKSFCRMRTSCLISSIGPLRCPLPDPSPPRRRPDLSRDPLSIDPVVAVS